MTPEQFVRTYPVIEERVSAFLAPGTPSASEAFCEDRRVRRFFRRVGILPRGARGARASQTILDVIGAVARTNRADVARAKAVLAAYCQSDGEVAAVCDDVPNCPACPLAADCTFYTRKPTIKQMPEMERPRERLAGLGEDHLTDAELLAIILGGGTVEQSAVDLARSLLVRFGGFRKLADCSTAQLGTVRGIGPARAAAVKAALGIAKRYHTAPPPAKDEPFHAPEAVFARYRSRLGGEKREIFVAALLDVKNRLIRDVTISQGSLTQSIVHPREAFEPAIRDSAAAVIFVHNHPSGDTAPSREDIDITRRLKETGDVIGIRVLDHVIVSETGFTSLAAKGLI